MRFEIVNMISSIFTAIGTTGAVIISLWLIYKSDKIKAKAAIGVYSPYIQKNNTIIPSWDKEVLMLSVSNIGTKPFSITNFVAKISFSKKKYIIFPDYNHPGCTKKYFIYNEADSGHYIFPIKEFTESLLNILNIKTGEPFSKNQLKKLKIFITTNLGQYFKVKFDNEFFQNYLESANKLNNNRKNTID